MDIALNRYYLCEEYMFKRTQRTHYFKNGTKAQNI
jgi:hypothetical protein